MKLFVIGDIHGCLDELTKLLVLVDNKVAASDKIVFVGDYVDRGPNSKGVIDLLISRAANHPIEHVFLKGNHEDMMLKGEYWGMNGGMETLASYGIDQYAAYEPDVYMPQIPVPHREFLAALKLYHKVGRTVVVHAGLNPFKPLEEQSEDVMLWDRTFYGFDGEYVGDLKVVIGHTPMNLTVVEKRNQIAVDTACAFGGRLSCAIIEPESGTLIDVIQVKSGFDY